MAPVTSAMDDPPVGDQNLHPYVMFLGRNIPLDQLEIVAEPDHTGLSAGMLQKTVVVAFAVSDTVTGRVKGNTGYDDQVRLISQMITAGGARLHNAETPLRETAQSLNLAKNHPVPADGRIQDPFTDIECGLQNSCSIRLIMGRRIQGNTTCPRKLVEGNKLLLGHQAGLTPFIMAKRPTPGQYLLTK
jgi:hypothetical protein